jgi:hypothetical protein
MPTDPELFKQLYASAFPVVVTAYFNGSLATALQFKEADYTDVATVTNDLAAIAHQYLLRSLESLPQDDLNLPPRPFSVSSTAPAGKDKPVQHHQLWTPEEDTRLSAEFKADPDIKRIAALHNRSELAIKSRLLRLKLITGVVTDQG